MQVRKTPAQTQPAAQRATRAAGVALLGYAYYLVAVAALHFVRPDVDPLQRTISEYAVGPSGWVMSTAFLAFALATLALVAGLYWGVPPAARSIPGLLLLAVCGLGVIVVALFPTDLLGEPFTTAGLIHIGASLLAFPSLVLAILLLSWRFRRADAWHGHFQTAWRLTWLVVPLFVAYFFASTSPLVGLLQRIFIASTLAWLMLTAARLRAAGTTLRAEQPRIGVPSPRH